MRHRGGMSRRLPAVLSSADLPAPELAACRLDGEVYAIDRCFVPVDTVEQPRHRALAARVGLSDRMIAERASAAWIWGAKRTPPRTHQFCVVLGARVSHSAATWLSVREVVLAGDDVVSLDGLRVTSPLRTALDLARFSSEFAAEERAMVRALAVLDSFDLAICLERLDVKRNLPNKRRAVERLLSCWSSSTAVLGSGAQPELTR